MVTALGRSLMNFAAAPIFFLMAIVTYLQTFQASMLCTATGGFGFISTMWFMYVVMAVVHSEAWVSLAWNTLKKASPSSAPAGGEKCAEVRDP
jgi:hypothetical protein